MIYLASPYSHPDQSVRELRYQINVRVTVELIQKGYAIFSPIVYAHPFTEQGLPTDWSYWNRYDRDYLTHCDLMLVLQLDGWEESEGVQAEITIAERLGTPVWYHNPASWLATLPPVTEVKRC